MKRISIQPRKDWQKQVEDLGFTFHSIDNYYWNESNCYVFTKQEIEQLENATNELYNMCLNAVQYVIDNNLFHLLKIPEKFVPLIVKSWIEEETHPSIYARFDLGFKNGKVKMYEINADTPTTLFEASIVQWHWFNNLKLKNIDQFNLIHESLIDNFKSFDIKSCHFSCINGSIEDYVTTEYLRDCVEQSGIKTNFLYINEIGVKDNFYNRYFIDKENKEIENIFKLYAWEWLIHDDFGKHLVNSKTTFIEPAWKMILSNKGIMAILWKMYPNNPLLLETYIHNPNGLMNYAKKPLLSREGQNVTLVLDSDDILEENKGEYGYEGYIYQELFTLPNFDGFYPVIGSWIVGQESVGIGIRESKTLITNNYSNFVPHYFTIK